MKALQICATGTFIAGLTVGWVGGTYRQAKSLQEAVRLFKTIELDNADKRAKEAYAKQPPIVGIWELKHAADLLQEARTAQYEGPKSMNLKLFLVHARLARLYDLEENQNKAQEHFREAVRYYNEDQTNAKIDNFQTLLGRLEKFDEIGKVERSP